MIIAEHYLLGHIIYDITLMRSKTKRGPRHWSRCLDYGKAFFQPWWVWALAWPVHVASSDWLLESLYPVPQLLWVSSYSENWSLSLQWKHRTYSISNCSQTEQESRVGWWACFIFGYRWGHGHDRLITGGQRCDVDVPLLSSIKEVSGSYHARFGDKIQPPQCEKGDTLKPCPTKRS